MSVGYLEQVLRKEREDAAVFTSLPHHYLEIASLLLNTASDDIGGFCVGRAVFSSHTAVCRCFDLWFKGRSTREGGPLVSHVVLLFLFVLMLA